MSMGRPELILIAMHQLSKGTTEPVQYEDLVVRAWELDRDAFGLRGYAEKYPDSSDLHKPLYGPLKKAGYVTATKKQFQLTERGVTEAARLGRLRERGDAPPPTHVSRDEMTRDKEREFERLLRSDAVKLIVSGEGADLVDSDFLAYLGVTARTPPGEAIGRLTTVEDAIKTSVKMKYRESEAKALQKAHAVLVKKFASLLPVQEA